VADVGPADAIVPDLQHQQAARQRAADTSGRRPELALLRLTGATRRQIVWIIAAESLVLTIAAVAASAAISGLVLGGLWVAFAHAAGFTPIAVPWLLIAIITGASALIGVVGSTLPVLGFKEPG
jgi:putative ABC transport system permease protein